jgi:hypothetical protein
MIHQVFSFKSFNGLIPVYTLDKHVLVPNLIVINYPKPTSGANALTNSPFLVIDDNQLRLT